MIFFWYTFIDQIKKLLNGILLCWLWILLIYVIQFLIGVCYSTIYISIIFQLFCLWTLGIRIVSLYIILNLCIIVIGLFLATVFKRILVIIFSNRMLVLLFGTIFIGFINGYLFLIVVFSIILIFLFISIFDGFINDYRSFNMVLVILIFLFVSIFDGFINDYRPLIVCFFNMILVFLFDLVCFYKLYVELSQITI